MKNLKIFLFVLLLSVAFTPKANAAGDFVEDQPATSSDSGDSTFDPFSDYSEFEEGSDEESDVNFFHNGRFFSVGLIGGYEMFTDVLGQLYQPNAMYGGFLSYFFSLRLAFQVSFINTDHSFAIIDGKTSTTYSGKINLQHIKFDFKYYLNTQNVTKGLAAINPYLIFGASLYNRTFTFANTAGFYRDNAFGGDAGVGVEIPLMRNKWFIGAQAMYNYIAFPDEGAPMVIGGTSTGINPSGDGLAFLGVLGFNF